MNGWLAGPIVEGVDSTLLFTEDGGATWTIVPSPDGATWSPMTVATANGLVSVIAFDDQQTLGVFTSPVRRALFVRSPAALQTGAGPVYDATIALSESSGWLVYNDRVLSGAARLVDGQWVDWQTPCSTTDPSRDVADVAASPDGVSVVVSCTTSGFAEPPASIRLFVSGDGGETFTETSPVENGAQAAELDVLPAVSFVAAPANNVIVVGYTRNDGAVVIVHSADRGTTWTSTQHIADDQMSGWLFPWRTPPEGSGTIVVQTSPTGGLRSTNAGRTWSNLPVTDHLPIPPS